MLTDVVYLYHVTSDYLAQLQKFDDELISRNLIVRTDSGCLYAASLSYRNLVSELMVKFEEQNTNFTINLRRLAPLIKNSKRTPVENRFLRTVLDQINIAKGRSGIIKTDLERLEAKYQRLSTFIPNDSDISLLADCRQLLQTSVIDNLRSIERDYLNTHDKDTLVQQLAVIFEHKFLIEKTLYGKLPAIASQATVTWGSWFTSFTPDFLNNLYTELTSPFTPEFIAAYDECKERVKEYILSQDESLLQELALLENEFITESTENEAMLII